MKEFLTAGVSIAALTLFGMNSGNPVCESDRPFVIRQPKTEGFVPHQQITLPPIQNDGSDGLLPDFGSQAYL